MTEPIYGIIRRCRRHPPDRGCEASWDDCLIELLPVRLPEARWSIEEPAGLPEGSTDGSA